MLPLGLSGSFPWRTRLEVSSQLIFIFIRSLSPSSEVTILLVEEEAESFPFLPCGFLALSSLQPGEPLRFSRTVRLSWPQSSHERSLWDELQIWLYTRITGTQCRQLQVTLLSPYGWNPHRCHHLLSSLCVLTWNSLCLQSMNLGSFEVIVGRRGSRVWLNLFPVATPVGPENKQTNKQRPSKGKKGKEVLVNSWAEKRFILFPV